MVAFKAAQLVSFLKKPDRRLRAALLYGPDAGQVADHAAALAGRIVQDRSTDAEIIRIDERDLAENPDRISVETRTVSMFAGLKVVRVTAGPRLPLDAVEAALADPGESWLIVEAGNLRPDAKLRKLFEASPNAAALPCYELAARDIAAFVDEELGAAGVTIEADARKHVVALFGGDSARARQEVRKLALYAGDGGRVTLDDVDAVVGDVSQAAYDTLCAAAAAGRTREALRQLDRLIATGQGAQGAIAALARHFERLHRLCARIESGDSARTALAGFRPPLHFRQRDALEAQSRNWSRARAASAIRLTGRVALSARRQPALERQFAERLLIALGQ